MSLSVAAVLCIAAVIIALWPSEPGARTPQKTQAPASPITEAPPDASPQTDMVSTTASLPTQFTNPFDASEVFEFPPGTPRDEARESVAEMLLERASERNGRHLANASIVK